MDNGPKFISTSEVCAITEEWIDLRISRGSSAARKLYFRLPLKRGYLHLIGLLGIRGVGVFVEENPIPSSRIEM
jgi:hypothetical protein